MRLQGVFRLKVFRLLVVRWCFQGRILTVRGKKKRPCPVDTGIVDQVHIASIGQITNCTVVVQIWRMPFNCPITTLYEGLNWLSVTGRMLGSCNLAIGPMPGVG